MQRGEKMPEPQYTMKSAKEYMFGGLALIAVGIGAMAFYEYGLFQPSVLARGKVVVPHKSDRHQTVTRATRRVGIGGRTFWQVEIEPGVWTDCGSDCAATLRQAVFKD